MRVGLQALETLFYARVVSSITYSDKVWGTSPKWRNKSKQRVYDDYWVYIYPKDADCNLKLSKVYIWNGWSCYLELGTCHIGGVELVRTLFIF